MNNGIDKTFELGKKENGMEKRQTLLDQTFTG